MKKICSLLVILFIAVAFMPTVSYGVTNGLAAPAVSTTVTSKTVKLSWKKITGASKYQVYRANSSDGKYKRIKTTTAKSYTNKKLTTGKTYFYKVRALKKKNYSPYCTVAATPYGKPTCRVSSMISTIKVRTNEVKGATGYEMFRASSKDGNYSLIGATDELYYDDMDAVTGKVYYYKMRVVKECEGYKTYSPWSDISSGTRLLEVPELQAKLEADPENETQNVMSISWTEVPAAEGYELWRSSDEGYNYNLIYSGKEVNYTDKTCNDGEKYYYKVRAFHTVDGVKAYSYSSRSKHSRIKLVKQAQSWLGYSEKNGKYKKLVDIYNNYKPLPRGMKAEYKEAWCTTTVTAAAIKSETVDIMPRERICRYMLDLYKELGLWVEDDAYVPEMGDLIMYDWEDDGVGDCVGDPNHIGIVTSVEGNTITVIEGNKSGTKGHPVSYRTITVNDKFIRGYATPLFDVDNGVLFVLDRTDSYQQESIEEIDQIQQTDGMPDEQEMEAIPENIEIN